MHCQGPIDEQLRRRQPPITPTRNSTFITHLSQECVHIDIENISPLYAHSHSYKPIFYILNVVILSPRVI